MIILYRCLLLAVAGLALEPTIPTNNNIDCGDFRINNGPLITPCVSEIILQKGQNYTMICKGSTKLRFKQQEISEEVTSNFVIVNTSRSISENGFSFERTLNLYNVDKYAIGYYACSDDFVDENIVDSLTEEPKNDEHVSYIYVYVNGTDNLLAPMKELIMSRSNKILIECRPSIPDVEVTLTPLDNAGNYYKQYYSPKIGFILYYDDNSYARLKMLDIFSCEFNGKDGRSFTKEIFVKQTEEPPVPVLKIENKRFLEGEGFSLNCTINVTLNVIAQLSWNLPPGLSMSDVSIYEENNQRNVTEGIVYSTLHIMKATKIHAGNYSCVSRNSPCDSKESNNVTKVYLDKPFLTLRLKNKEGITRQPKSSIALELDGYPPVNNFTVLRDGIKLLLDNEKYFLTFDNGTNDVKLDIKSLKVTDIATYTFIASNGKMNKTAIYRLLVGADPVNFFNVTDKKCDIGRRVSLHCDVSGYPLTELNVFWTFTAPNGETYDLQETNRDSKVYNMTSYVDVDCVKSGSITCLAKGKFRGKKDSKTRKIIVNEMPDGFGITVNTNDSGQLWVLEDDIVTVKCLASIYDFENVTWLIDNDEKTKVTVTYPPPTDFSYVSALVINKTDLSHEGEYKCVGKHLDGSEKYDTIKINVLELSPPAIEDPVDRNLEFVRYMNFNLNCTVTGAPRPNVKWYKDGEPLATNISNVEVYENFIDRTTVNATIVIKQIQPENEGKYECIAEGRNLIEKKAFTLKLKDETETNKVVTHYLIAIGVIILILIVLIIYLTVKIRKEKQFRKELAAAGLLYFKEGVINSLNPDLGIDEQAELLPYDEKFEFPPEKLVYGKQLGAGAFGVVYKAEARGIINAEETTPVAVKMVKKTADNMYIKALASELKIMVHLGKHINIVNLLGACTKNVGKRELVVIVEYCKYGNIHNYMQRHREVFIDQLGNDNKEKLGKVNRAYTTTSSGSTGMHSVSDYFGSANTQDTDNTFLNTANTVRSSRKNCPNNQQIEEAKASEGYVQPEWRSNYESDYSYDGRSPRPLSSRDLLAWSFQIARGMEYLASRKVLHGDLAARNILLADDNVVKICDFGLAKSIYKNEEYRTKENCLLPVKWLAIECMTDRIFSTQSDVWSFGIVLWEMFTLAKTPYPNIPPSSLLQFLSEGHRLDKPPYADDKLYGVMKKCWEAKPTMRPTFSQLQEILGTFLEDNVRNHYVDMNSSYMDKNAQAGQEDYLDMVCAPDYNNMVTPSPHHYVNTDNQSRFFPNSPVKVDEEGYLQVTNQGIFSPRSKDSEFDFDPRKFNPKSSDAGSCGSELTPMLTLNNLPRSGSESDHEGNAPYHNVCTRIDEETDEVFVPSLNDKNAKNIQSAVTNPTYITFDHIDEKPKDIMHSYVNMNVPNGLVK